MNAGRTLFPMTMLALAAGCSSPSDSHASARAGERREPVEALAAPDLRPGSPVVPDAAPATGEKPVSEKAPVREEAMATPLAPPAIADVPAPAPVFVPDLPPADGAADPQPFPDEVTRYMVDRDSCDHFRGEEAYDAERLAYLRENIAELCTGTDARLAVLRQRYAQDAAVMSALSGYEERIEGNASQ